MGLQGVRSCFPSFRGDEPVCPEGVWCMPLLERDDVSGRPDMWTARE